MVFIFILILMLIFLFLFVNYQNSNNKMTQLMLFIKYQEIIRNNKNLNIFAQILDCPKDSDEFITVIQQNLKGLDEYLGFFEESIAIGIPNSLTNEQSAILFSEHEELIKRHNFVRSYINRKDYKNFKHQVAAYLTII